MFGSVKGVGERVSQWKTETGNRVEKGVAVSSGEKESHQVVCVSVESESVSLWDEGE